MRAAVYRRFGGPEVVAPQEVPTPEPTGDQVLVRVLAASVSTSDAAARAGSPWTARLAFGPFRPRVKVLGSDFAGRVAQVGPDARRFAVGDLVFGATNAAMGAHAQYLAVSEAGPVEPMPEGIDPGRAAALVDATAMSFLRETANLQSGQRLLGQPPGPLLDFVAKGYPTDCPWCIATRPAVTISVSRSAEVRGG